MAIRPIAIPNLQERLPIVDEQRRPMSSFIRSLNLAFRQLATSFNGQAEIVAQLAALAGIVDDQGELIAAQQTQIEEIAEQQQLSNEALSLQNSGVTNEVGVMSVNTGGSVTVADHTRTYGDSALNPPVSVNGAVVATGQPTDTVVYIFYSDPARVGGAVTYQWSVDSDALVQSGSNHAVGSAQVPPSGSAPGDYVRPR